MTGSVYFVEPTDSVARVRKLFLQHKIAHLPVVGQGKVVGMVSDKELSDALYREHDPIDAVPVSRVMREKIAVADPHDSPEKVAKEIMGSGVSEATVFGGPGSKVLGIITKTDLTRYFAANYSGKAAVHSLMKAEVKTIGRFHSIFRAAREMEENDIARLVVMDSGPVGIITARDLAMATYGLRPEKLVYATEDGARQVHFKPIIVDDLMRQELSTIPSKSDAASAAKLMLERGIGSLIVMDGTKLKGIITKTDLVSYLAKQA